VSNGEIARERAQAETDRRFVCVVEIPKGSRNKYEYDPELGGIKFDAADERRHLPHRLRLYPGHTRRGRRPARRAGVPHRADLPRMPDPGQADRDVRDARREGTRRQDPLRPVARPYWNSYEQVEELPELLRQEIEQFFSIYKELEHKLVEVGGWRSRADALEEVDASERRFSEPHA
jgi:inorganic pyrophosphatase